jgi:hypothetical protein
MAYRHRTRVWRSVAAAEIHPVGRLGAGYSAWGFKEFSRIAAASHRGPDPLLRADKRLGIGDLICDTVAKRHSRSRQFWRLGIMASAEASSPRRPGLNRAKEPL